MHKRGVLTTAGRILGALPGGRGLSVVAAALGETTVDLITAVLAGTGRALFCSMLRSTLFRASTNLSSLVFCWSVRGVSKRCRLLISLFSWRNTDSGSVLAGPAARELAEDIAAVITGAQGVVVAIPTVVGIEIRGVEVAVLDMIEHPLGNRATATPWGICRNTRW